MSPSLLYSASECLFLPPQDSYLRETFQECYALKYVEELSVQEGQRKLTGSIRAKLLHHLRDNIDQSTCRNATNESSIALTRDAKETKKEKKKTEAKQTIIQRIKQ